MERKDRNIIRIKRMLAVGMIAVLASFMPVRLLWAGIPSDSFVITFTVDLGIPTPVTDLVAVTGIGEGEVILTWTAPSSDPPPAPPSAVSSYEIRAATFSISSLGDDTTYWWNNATCSQSFPATKLPGETESETFRDLAVSTTWYFAIKSKDSYGIESAIDVNAATPGNQAFAIAKDLVPVAPSGLTAVLPSTNPITYVTLLWDDMTGNSGYLDFDEYRLYRSTTELPVSGYTAIAVSSAAYYIDVSISTGTTYYYYVTAVDCPPEIFESSASAIVSVYITPPLPPPTELIKSLPPSGVRMGISNNHPVFSWHAPVSNEDITPCTDQEEYRIFRSVNVTSDWSQVASVPHTGVSDYQWTDSSLNTIDSSVHYYKVRCVDALGNESNDSMICDTSRDGNILIASLDKQAVIVVPKEINGILNRDTNGSSVDIQICVEDIDSSSIPNSIMSYEFYAVNASNYQRIEGFKFEESLVRFIWQYDRSSRAIQRVIPNLAPEEYDNQLSILWFNGVEWIKLSKEPTIGAFEIRTQQIGKFMIILSMKANTFVLNKVYPKIFTPNGDNRNDHVEFQYENPKYSGVSGKIFNLRGGYINKLQSGSNYNSLMWDGTTESGKIAESGVYIYQIEVTGEETKIINGVIILAK